MIHAREYPVLAVRLLNAAVLTYIKRFGRYAWQINPGDDGKNVEAVWN